MSHHLHFPHTHLLIVPLLFIKLQWPEGALTLALDLSTELGTDGLVVTGRGRGSSSATGSHLDSNDTAEWASVGGVDDLDEADVGLASNGSGAGGTGGDGGSEGVVLVDVGGTLDNAHVDEHSGHESALLGCGNVTLGTWDLLGDGQLGTSAEGTGSSGVDDGGVRSSSVSGDDVDGSGDGATWGDLGEGAAGESHDLSHIGQGVGAGLGLSESVRCGGLGVEDSGVDLSLLVGSWAWDDTTLDTKTSGVSTGITSHDGDLAVGGNERGCYESKEEDLGEHVCGGWVSEKELCK